MKNIELLVFDLDGTIADTQQDLMASVNYVRALHGIAPLDLYTLRTYIGNGIVTLMERAMPGLPKKELEEVVDQFRTYYRAHLLATTKLYPGVKDVLKRYQCLKKTVLTNKSESLSLELLRGLGIIDHFAIVWGGDTGRRRKPDPEPLLQIIARMKTAKEKSIMIGDGPNDLLAAQNAGVRSVAVTYGYSDRQELLKYHPDFMIDSLDEVKKILE